MPNVNKRKAALKFKEISFANVVPAVLTSIGEPNEVEPKEAIISPLASMVKVDADISKRDSAGGKLEIRVCEIYC